MPSARKTQISLDATPYYHLVSRCVRRAYLCGKDRFTGKCFEHRRRLIESEIHRLSKVFFIQPVAYAVMSNHYHLVVFLNTRAYEQATLTEIVERWHCIHKGTELSERFVKKEQLNAAEWEHLYQQIELWRERLFSISWMMRVINEKIARMANAEDDVTGRFWEGRFKCQALLDEKALLSCMAYVDLNPVRAGMVKTVEDSKYTSVNYRINFWKGTEDVHQPATLFPKDEAAIQPSSLQPFLGIPREIFSVCLPMKLADYLSLVDWTGRQIKAETVGYIEPELASVLQKLGISAEHWVYLCSNFESRFKGLVGSVKALKESIRHFGRKRLINSTQSKALFT